MIESKRSESIMNLAAALAIAQGQIKTASKDAKGNYSKYSSLDAIWDACRQPLSENGLSVVQIPSTGENELLMETILLHSSGEWISGTISLPLVSGRTNEHQALGSAITYARRYSFAPMVGIASGDDDDGEAGGKLVERSGKSKVKANDEMTPAKLLAHIEKDDRIKGFYNSPDAIMACRPKSSSAPAPDDTEGWRQLFVDARDFAFGQLDQAIREGQVSPDQIPMSEAEVVRSAAADDLEDEFPEICADQSE